MYIQKESICFEDSLKTCKSSTFVDAMFFDPYEMTILLKIKLKFYNENTFSNLIQIK